MVSLVLESLGKLYKFLYFSESIICECKYLRPTQHAAFLNSTDTLFWRSTQGMGFVGTHFE